MATVTEIVQRAYRKSGIVDSTSPLEAEELNEGIDALNAMMHAWKLAGVDITHADLGATDNFSLAAEYEEGTIYLLASRLNPHFQIPDAFDADDWFRKFQAHNFTMPSQALPSAIQCFPSQRNRRYS